MIAQYPTHSGHFGAWESSWSKHCPEIDRMIIRFMEDTEGFGPDSLAKLTMQVSDWLDSRQLNGEAWQQWRWMRQEPARLQARIEQRIAHLVADGSLRLCIWRRGWHY
ncbi:MAG: hypothetical protein R3F46_02975 [bacterium]